jgi:hypothetical protein
MPPRIDLSGREFGRLRVTGAADLYQGKRLRWSCVCECGTTTTVYGESLRRGDTLSCGCLGAENRLSSLTTHGLNVGGPHPLYGTWINMKQRCSNPKASRYSRYGGRGIRVCDRWVHGEGGKPAFECFVEDMGPKPTPQHSIERKDKDGNYEPGNCRWSIPTEQARNRRTTVSVDFDGEKISLAEYCERQNLTYKIVHQRLSRGWSLERATNYPVRIERARLAAHEARP